MRNDILKELRALRDPTQIKLPTYRQYIEDAIEYVKTTQDAPKKPEYFEKHQLLKLIVDDMVNGKCDGLVLRKVNYYLYLLEREDE